MGLPNKYLYATNTGEDKIFLSAWKPIKKEGGYCWNPEAPIGNEMWIPNVLDLTEEEGTVPVKIVRSQEETGIWIICYDDYFGGEKHIYVYKPRFLEGTTRLDYNYPEDLRDTDDIFGIHVTTEFEMIAGEGPWPVTFVRGVNFIEEPKKPSFIKKLFQKIFCKKKRGN